MTTYSPSQHFDDKSADRRLKIWQWNCRTIKLKRHNLSQLTEKEKPDILALQETGTDSLTLRGYETHIADGRTRTAILTSKYLTTQQHSVQHRIENTVVEILPPKKNQKSLFILNIYSPPSDKLGDLDNLIRSVLKVTKCHKLIMVGDFNAPHVAWGYTRTLKKGAEVHNVAQQYRLTLWNDTQHPTRIGNSVSKDTSPDLAFSRGIPHVEWERLDETLGSDHHIVQLSLNHHHNRTPTRVGKARITDWKAFREEEDDVENSLDDLEKWTKSLVERANKYTKEIQLTIDDPAVDPHLLHTGRPAAASAGGGRNKSAIGS